MNTFTVPDICDENEDVIIGDLFLKSYGGVSKFFGEVRTVECPHSNSVVKEMVEENGNGKVLFINHTGSELCSMVGDQIAQKAYDNNWNGIITNGYIRDIEVIKDIPIGVYARNSYPMKTNKSIGKGQVNVPIKINDISINPSNWIYIDLNGWIISKSELEL